MTFEELFSIIKQRQTFLPKDSFTASLFKEGEDKVIQKVGEEAIEVVIAAKNKSKKRLVSEIADVFFMILVLMAAKGIPLDDIFEEMEKRRK